MEEPDRMVEISTIQLRGGSGPGRISRGRADRPLGRANTLLTKVPQAVTASWYFLKYYLGLSLNCYKSQIRDIANKQIFTQYRFR
jgi:hypothetical protein